MKYLILPLFCLSPIFSLCQSHDQFVISPQGDYNVGSTMSLSWTIGDLVTETYFSDDKFLTQGFQQPILSVREIPSTDKIEASVYPNPFGSTITLVVQDFEQDYYIDLFDVSGKLLWKSKSQLSEQEIDLQDLPAAQYLLRITSQGFGYKTFQITKAQ